MFFGSPIWDPTSFSASFIKEVVEKVSLLQECLQSLENPQVEPHLLHTCPGVCKINHLLCTISPDTIMPQLQLFGGYLRDSLSQICNASISDNAGCQATLPLSFGSLGLRKASCVSPAALLAFASHSSQSLCTQLLYLTVLLWLCPFFSTYSWEGVNFCLSVLFDRWSSSCC